MFSAAGVEGTAAVRTVRTAVQILADRELIATRTAKHRQFIPFLQRPHDRVVVRHRLMTFETWEPMSAAFEFYGDDIQLAAVVPAACLRVEPDAVDMFAMYDLYHPLPYTLEILLVVSQ